MAERITLIADEGYVYTDGKIYGSVIYLAEGVSADNFKQIPREEYDQMLNADESELATEEDYQNALRELGAQI
jgi:hypothetical protein